MADTTTTLLGLTKPQIGGSNNSWGDKLSTDLDLLDAEVSDVRDRLDAAETELLVTDGRLDDLEMGNLSDQGTTSGEIAFAFSVSAHHSVTVNGSSNFTLSNSGNASGIMTVAILGAQSAVAPVTWAGVTLDAALLPSTITVTKYYLATFLVRPGSIAFLYGKQTQ